MADPIIGLSSAKTIGMDIKAPFGVYVDGEKVADYSCVEDANKHYSMLAKPNKMQIIVAEQGKFMETLRIHAGTAVAVLPGGVDWSEVVAGDDPWEAIINLPLQPTKEVAHV